MLRRTLLRISALVTFVALFVCAPQAHAGAGALRWHGYIQTDLEFSEFFSGEHTIMGRFMLQYPGAYRGPMFGVRPPRCAVCPPGGSYSIGMEGYNGNPRLVLEVDGSVRRYTVPGVTAGAWQHIAVTRSQVDNVATVFQLYLNGTPRCADPPSPCDLVVMGGVSPPNGVLALGRTWGQTTGDISSSLQQFYGFLDDVAVFDDRLSSATINAYAAASHVLSGTEAGLLAGYAFEVTPPPAKLARPVSYAEGARREPFVGSTGFGPDASQHDATNLPIATANYAMPLPLPAGQAWKVVQGYGLGGSHTNNGEFALDIARTDGPTIGSSVYLPLAGTVKVAVDSFEEDGCPKGDDFTNCNKVYVEISPGMVLTFRHLKKGSITAAPGTYLPAGTKIAEVGAHPNGAHLHFGVTQTYDDSEKRVTMPAIFTNYQLKKSGSNWTTVSLGVPADGSVVRVP
jgi:murein DD-endopeptidase MepM/ murein hydrolase activator NlpD